MRAGTCDTMCLLFCVDDAYAAQLGVCLSSLVTSNPNNKLEVYIALLAGRSGEVERISRRVADRHKSMVIYVIEVEENIFSTMPKNRRFSDAAYCRIIFDRLIDERHKIVLYLDADMLIRHDLKDLHFIPLENYVCGAVRDYMRLEPSQIGFGEDEPYFNSGLLLINRSLWKKGVYEEALIDLLEQHADRFAWADQDALNIVLRNQIKELPVSWNYQPRYADVPASFLGLDERAYAAVRKDPCVVHFTTSLKPWTDPDAIHYSEFFEAEAIASGLPQVLRQRRRLSLTAIKTMLRWRYPKAFRYVKFIVFPKKSKLMYRSAATGS